MWRTGRHRARMHGAGCAIFVLGLSFAAVRTPALADELADLRLENAALKSRVEALEKEMARVADWMKAQPAPKEERKTIAEPAKSAVSIHGYVKADLAWDSSRVDDGNFARWALPEDGVAAGSPSRNDDQFSLTARQTRLWLDLPESNAGKYRLTGKVEADFYNTSAENKNALCLRHAYFKLERPSTGFSLLAGQSSDVVSPLVPDTLNYTVAWWVGNIGYRRPQVRVTQGFSPNAAVKGRWELALARTIGDDHPYAFIDDTGKDSGFPTVQGRLSFDLPAKGSGAAVVGLSGHYGTEEYDDTPANDGADLKTWSVNVDLDVPLGARTRLRGEWFSGENLDAYLGGIGQGITVKAATDGTAYDAAETIGASGGWAALSFTPAGPWRFNLGGGVDDPDDGDLTAGARSRNAAVWANAIRKIGDSASVGVELSHWKTDYTGQAAGTNDRVQTSLTYQF